MEIPGISHKGPLSPCTDEEIACAKRLKADVVVLAQTIGERNTGCYSALQKAEHYIAGQFELLGYGVRKEIFTANGVKVANVEATLPGTQSCDEIVIVGAHYDSAIGTPGANDNASGIAVLLELARQFKQVKPEKTLRFVAFVNEEPPYFQTDLMGSRVYCAHATSRKEKIVAMLCLECLGVYSDRPNSQQYPAFLEQQYPDTANFIAFCSNLSSSSLLRKCIEEFRRSTAFPSEGLIAAEDMEGVGWSDHYSFWRENFPAIMITDTAFLRYEGYHLPIDRPDRLDYERMAVVTGGIIQILHALVC